jgi:hypothetical protein
MKALDFSVRYAIIQHHNGTGIFLAQLLYRSQGAPIIQSVGGGLYHNAPADTQLVFQQLVAVRSGRRLIPLIGGHIGKADRVIDMMVGIAGSRRNGGLGKIPPAAVGNLFTAFLTIVHDIFLSLLSSRAHMTFDASILCKISDFF